MKLNRLTFFLSLCFLLVHCKSPSDQIKEAFDKVDQSLEKSNASLSNSIEELYLAINSKRQKNQELALKADTIYLVTIKATKFIDSLKQAIQLQDTSGTNLDLATKLLVNTNTGEDVTKTLSDVYFNTTSYPIDNAKKKSLDSVLQSIKEIQDDNNWTKKYFETTPTIAAVTILTKFKNDCTKAATLTLNDINQRLTE